MNLIQNFFRTIQTKLLNVTRPLIPEIGENHVDNPTTFTDQHIYPNELAIHLNSGKLYTSDSQEPVELNTEDAIIEGLVVRTAGVSHQYVSINSGKIRIKGRLYKHTATENTADTSFLIQQNNTSFPRIDLIVCEPNFTIYDNDDKLYGLSFTDVKGTPSLNPEPPNVPSGKYLLGMVYVKANNTNSDTLRPLSVSEGTGNNPIINQESFPYFLHSSKGYVKYRTTTTRNWTENTLLFKDQILKTNNVLYEVLKNHQSTTNIDNDVTNNKIRPFIGDGTININVEILDDLNGEPTNGPYTNGFFQWGLSYKIRDAFYDLNNLINKLVPDKPSEIENVNIELNNEAYEGLKHTNASLEEIITSDATILVAKNDPKFYSHDEGIIRVIYDEDNQNLLSDDYTVTNNNTDNDTLTNLDLEIEIEKDDHYSGISQKEGIFKSFLVTATKVALETGSLIKRAFKFVYEIDSVENFSKLEFYVDTLNTPSISNITNISAIHSGKYLSGVPVLKEDDIVKVDYRVNDAVGYFMNSTNISKIQNSNLKDRIIAYTTKKYTDTNDYIIQDRVPYTSLSQQLNHEAEIKVEENAYTENLGFDIIAYNARGTDENDDIVTENVTSTGIVIDDISEEINYRYYSDIGQFPSWNFSDPEIHLYNNDYAQQSLLNNEELQYLGQRYFYPHTNYSNLPLYDGTNQQITGDNYSHTDISNTSYNTYRWATFKIGTITNERFIIFRINEATNFTSDFDDGVTMTNDIKLYVNIVNTGNNTVTGWFDANKAYNLVDPSSNGDAALDAGSSTVRTRRITFGDNNKTGDVYVRIGLPYGSNKSFKDIIAVDTIEEETDTDWTEYILTEYTNVKSITINLTGTVNITEDFESATPLVMTSGLYLQAKLVNSVYGTDWLDINTAYTWGNPINYNDAALDVSESTATTRRITFGTELRSGILRIRYKSNTNQEIGGITVTSYT